MYAILGLIKYILLHTGVCIHGEKKRVDVEHAYEREREQEEEKDRKKTDREREKERENLHKALKLSVHTLSRETEAQRRTETEAGGYLATLIPVGGIQHQSRRLKERVLRN